MDIALETRCTGLLSCHLGKEYKTILFETAIILWKRAFVVEINHNT